MLAPNNLNITCLPLDCDPYYYYPTNPQIICYAFPFGIAGWVSHFISLYTIAIISLGRRPLRPNKLLQSENLDMGLSAAGILMSLGVGIPMITRCNHDSRLLLVAYSKLATSTLADLVGLGVSWYCRQYNEAPPRTRGRFEERIKIVPWILTPCKSQMNISYIRCLQKRTDFCVCVCVSCHSHNVGEFRCDYGGVMSNRSSVSLEEKATAVDGYAVLFSLPHRCRPPFLVCAFLGDRQSRSKQEENQKASEYDFWRTFRGDDDVLDNRRIVR